MKDVGGISNEWWRRESSFIQEGGKRALVWWWAEVLGCHQGGELRNIWPSCMATVPRGHYFLSPKLCSVVGRFGRTFERSF